MATEAGARGGAQRILGSGEFFGRSLRQSRLGGLTLMDTLYAPAQRIPRHAHEPAYFCALLAGGYWEQYGSRRVSYVPGDVVFHPPGETHYGDIGPEGGRTFNLALSAAWLERAEAHGAVPRESVEFHGEALDWLARRLHRELAEPEAASGLIAEGIALEMLGVLLRKSARTGSAPPSWLARAEERLREEFAQPLTAVGVAREVGVEPVRLARAFRRHFGETLGERLRRIRVDHACRRLREAERPLAAIAAEAGFADQSHLTRVFKKQTGMTPGAYRRSKPPES